jgi:hypothetical protein
LTYHEPVRAPPADPIVAGTQTGRDALMKSYGESGGRSSRRSIATSEAAAAASDHDDDLAAVGPELRATLRRHRSASTTTRSPASFGGRVEPIASDTELHRRCDRAMRLVVLTAASNGLHAPNDARPEGPRSLAISDESSFTCWPRSSWTTVERRIALLLSAALDQRQADVHRRVARRRGTVGIPALNVTFEGGRLALHPTEGGLGYA